MCVFWFAPLGVHLQVQLVSFSGLVSWRLALQPSLIYTLTEYVFGDLLLAWI